MPFVLSEHAKLYSEKFLSLQLMFKQIAIKSDYVPI